MSKLKNINKLLEKRHDANNAYVDTIKNMEKLLEISVGKIKDILKSTYKDTEFIVIAKMHGEDIDIIISMDIMGKMKVPNTRYILSFYPDKNTTINVDQNNGVWSGGLTLELFIINQIVNYMESTYK